MFEDLFFVDKDCEQRVIDRIPNFCDKQNGGDDEGGDAGFGHKQRDVAGDHAVHDQLTDEIEAEGEFLAFRDTGDDFFGCAGFRRLLGFLEVFFHIVSPYINSLHRI